NEIPLNMFSRILLHSQNDFPPYSNDVSESVVKEVEPSANRLKNFGWETTLDDYTETVKRGAGETNFSYRVLAKNDTFECIHSVTVAPYYGKRTMIECAYKLKALDSSSDLL